MDKKRCSKKKKKDVVHIRSGITALKKNEIMLFAMDFEMIIPSEISQTKTSII